MWKDIEYQMWTIRKKILFILYGLTAKWLPISQHSSLSKKFRVFWAKKIITTCGKNVNIERGSFFTPQLEIGDNSGIGINCEVYGPVKIGDNVMMGPEVVIYTRNHKIEQTDIPIQAQGYTEDAPVIIGNDVWIGRRVIILPGTRIGNGCVIGAGAVVTRDLPSFSVSGGVPARVIKMRKAETGEQ